MARFGSVRPAFSGRLWSGVLSCLVLSGRVPRLWAMCPSSHRTAPLAGRASVRSRRSGRSTPWSGPCGAVARRLGQVPAERSLDASVRYPHSTCHVWAMHPSMSPFGAARGAGLGPVLHGTPVRFSSIRFGSVRFRSVLSSYQFHLLVSIDPVSIVMSCLGHVPVSVTVRRRSRGGPRSGPGGAVARRLGQVPAERSLDASVRFQRSGRSTPRSGTPTVRVMSCLGPAPVSVTVRRRSRGGPRSSTPRYPSSDRFDSVRFRSVLSSYQFHLLVAIDPVSLDSLLVSRPVK